MLNKEPDKKDSDILKIKKVIDITDELKKKNRQRELLKVIRDGKTAFEDAYRMRRQRLLEINAIYNNQSYLDRNKAGWQTRMFLPLTYNSVEKKTSMVHQSLWGNRFGSPYTTTGLTAESHDFAESAEAVLNNTMTRIGFYGTSEEVVRSTCKYGLGAYRYGWVRRMRNQLARVVRRDEKGKVIRDDQNRPIYDYALKPIRMNEPFVRAIDVVDHLGWDPTAKTFDPWGCAFVYEIREESKESIYEQEVRGVYDPGSYDKLKHSDPHNLTADAYFGGENKEPQMRRDEGVMVNALQPLRDRYGVMDWYGWFDVDGDGLREFIKASVVLENDQILSAEENLMGEYPFVDVQYSKSLHSLTPKGIIDPVVEIQYGINEFLNQRGDSIKLKLHPQFLINVDKILEDHAYVSMPGAFHPFQAGDNPIQDVMKPLEFQSLEGLGANEQDRLMSFWNEVTGVADLQKVLNTSNKNTPASTIMSIFDQQQSGNSMIINGILDRHGVLGSRVLRMIQLFGDEEFIVRTAGRKGFQFHTESLENILGDYDVKVTTSTFFGNKEVELQQLIQLRPLWAQAQHIDLVEVDKAILENILPKKMDKILNVPPDPLTPMQEIVMFLYGKGADVSVSPLEDISSLRAKLRILTNFMSHEAYRKLDGQTHSDFHEHLDRINESIQSLQTQQQLQQAQAAQGLSAIQPDQNGPQGNMGNQGSPNMRTMMNNVRPNVPAPQAPPMAA